MPSSSYDIHLDMFNGTQSLPLHEASRYATISKDVPASSLNIGNDTNEKVSSYAACHPVLTTNT